MGGPRVGTLYYVHDRGLDLDEAVDNEAAPLRPVPAGASVNLRAHFLLWLADPRGDAMSDRVRIIKHEAVPACGSFDVRFPDRPSQFFYWDDLPSRRLRPETLDRETALEKAKAEARAAREES